MINNTAVIITITISFISLGFSIYSFYMGQKSKQKHVYFSIMNDNTKFLYKEFPKLVDCLDSAKGDLEDKCKKIKDAIFENVKPLFLDLKFRNENLYNKINKNLIKLEEKVACLIETSSYSDDCNDIKKIMKEFYSLLDNLYC